LDVSADGTSLTGQVNAARTQVFLGGPSFSGQVSAGQDGTHTVRIESEVFKSIVSRRPIERQFVLTGDVLKDGDRIEGSYTETISGFTPKPMLVTGTFLIVRPNGSAQLIPNNGTLNPTPTSTVTPTPATPVATATSTATPIATPTATPTEQSSAEHDIFLPNISHNSPAVSSGADASESVSGQRQDETQAVGLAQKLAGVPATLLLNSQKLVLVHGGSSAEVVAVVRDASGKPVPNVSVAFSVQGGSVTTASSVSNANGRATTTFQMTATLGQAVVSAQVDGLTQQVVIQVVKAQSDATTHVLTLEAPQGKLNLGEQMNVVVILRDSDGQPLSGQSVSFFGSFGHISPASAVTDASGRAQVSYQAGTRDGLGTITALAGYAAHSLHVQVGEITKPPEGDTHSIYLPSVKR